MTRRARKHLFKPLVFVLAGAVLTGCISPWPDSVGRFKEAAELADRHYRLGAVPVATYVELQKQYLEAVEALLDDRP